MSIPAPANCCRPVRSSTCCHSCAPSIRVAPISRSLPSASASGRRVTAARPSTMPSTRRTSSRSRRRSSPIAGRAHRRPAVRRYRHARTVGSRADHGDRGADRQRRENDDRCQRGFYTNASHLACHPWLQPVADARAGRRDRHHAVAQPAARRWPQVECATWRTGRCRDDRVDRAHGQRSADKRARERPPHSVRARPRSG